MRETSPAGTPRSRSSSSTDGVRRPCARYLDHFHFDVAEAATPEQGLEILRQNNPAVILLEDAASPASEQIQQHARDRAIPVVSMTTAFGDAASRRAETLGAAGVLVKPFPLGTMLQEIRRVLRAHMAS